jgi:hypothetical protein
MWPTFEKNQNDVTENMREVVNDLMAAVGKRVL